VVKHGKDNNKEKELSPILLHPLYGTAKCPLPVNDVPEISPSVRRAKRTANRESSLVDPKLLL
jgi:hypothetical protein